MSINGYIAGADRQKQRWHGSSVVGQMGQRSTGRALVICIHLPSELRLLRSPQTLAAPETCPSRGTLAAPFGLLLLPDNTSRSSYTRSYPNRPQWSRETLKTCKVEYRDNHGLGMRHRPLQTQQFYACQDLPAASSSIKVTAFFQWAATCLYVVPLNRSVNDSELIWSFCVAFLSRANIPSQALPSTATSSRQLTINTQH